MHCCKRVWKLPYTRLRRSSSIAATSSTMACLNSWIVMICHWKSRSYRNPHRKKSGTVRSGDRAGQAVSPKREITVPNISRTTAILFRTIWNGVLFSTFPLRANHDKLSRRRNIQIRNVSVGSAPPCIMGRNRRGFCYECITRPTVFNSRVSAHKVYSLMLMVATIETYQNVDWLFGNFRMIFIMCISLLPHVYCFSMSRWPFTVVDL